MLARKADGCDFFACHDVMIDVLRHCRDGNGPAAVEFDTERFFATSKATAKVPGPGEVERLRETRTA